MKRLAVLLFPLLASACASPPGEKDEVYSERIYRTGSNLPVKDRSTRSDVKTVDPADVQRALDRGISKPMGGN